MWQSMDADILRTILNSYGDAKDAARSEDYKDVSRESILCTWSHVTLNTLCTSLSNLLCYKVSKEAYQRYSVRLLIIDILRKWYRMTSNFEHLHVFTSEKNSVRFVSKLLDKYLTDDVFSNCDADDALVSLTIAVIYLSIENSSFTHHIDRLLLKLSQIEANDKVERLLRDILHANLRLKPSTREEIYILRRSELIERPLLDSFAHIFPDASEENRAENGNNEEVLNRLLQFGAESACIFQAIFNFLKELLVQLLYAPAVVNFIEITLKRVTDYCENQGRDILDLYPRKLRSCVILLRIEPEQHTAHTREYTLQMLKNIFAVNKDTLLILMSHFPDWLRVFAIHVAKDTRN